MSEVATNQNNGGKGHNNRPTMATGMLEDNSSAAFISDGHPEFELIGSDFVPSQKAGVNNIEPTSPPRINDDARNNRDEEDVVDLRNVPQV